MAKSLKIGDPREPDTVISPLIRGTQCAVIDGHVDDAVGEAHAPFGRVKNSGFGREGGRFTMEETTELKWITIQSGQRAFPM